MIFQYSIVGYEWIIGLGLCFGLAFAFNHLTFNSLRVFFIFFTIFNAFVVWGELLPSWTLIISIIVLVIIMYMSTPANKGVD